MAFIGCNDDDVVNYNLEVGAYFQGIYLNDTAVYAPVLIAEFNPKPVSLTAIDKNEDKYVLESYWAGDYSYRWIPIETDYSKAPLEENTFKFTAIFEDTEQNIEKNASISLSTVPEPFKITETNYISERSELIVSWENTNADMFIVQISTNLTESPIFQSFNLIPDTEEIEENTQLTTTIKKSTLKWFSAAQNGEVYIVSVHAFNLKNGDINKITGEFIATKNIVWGK
ncbi:hypothetical protein C7377_1569 [Balneicella halophila]|uniref:Uncharacterized protein n=1 Tax=Balneicella halophila TaxID=1537566 RepID=A0A7L4UQB5_BALHA|nr:hypothetical protein [Balneicella halophila]PVX49930.1 hypothetical protein C7377_1569 [Balneicella halophila]